MIAGGSPNSTSIEELTEKGWVKHENAIKNPRKVKIEIS